MTAVKLSERGEQIALIIHRHVRYEAKNGGYVNSNLKGADEASAEIALLIARELEKVIAALEQIALLDEADGHELTVRHAFEAVAIATSTLGKHPSEIYAARAHKDEARK